MELVNELYQDVSPDDEIIVGSLLPCPNSDDYVDDVSFVIDRLPKKRKNKTAQKPNS